MRGAIGIAAHNRWGRNGLPPDLADRVEAQLRRVLAASDLPLHLAHRWSPGRMTLLVAWAKGPVTPPADLLTGGPGGCAAYTGYFSDPADVSTVAAGAPLPALVAGAGGCFSVYRQLGETLEAATIASRVDPVFIAPAPGAVILSSRALLAHLVAQALLTGHDRPSVRLDPLGMREVMMAGFCTTDATVFRGVRAIPASSGVTVSRRRITTWEDQPERVPAQALRPGSTGWDAQLDALADAALASVEPARRTGASGLPAYLGLSGGRDSRMIIAALSASKIEVSTGTSGDLNHPDVQVAIQLAQVLGIPHNVRVPTGATAADATTLVVPHPAELARHTVWTTDGMVSALDVPKLATSYIEDRVSMSGSGGEVVRGGYFCTEPAATPEIAFRTVDNLYGPRGWLTSSRFDELTRAHRHWRAAVAADPLDAMDRLYLHYRAGRWIAANRAATVTSARYLHPLLDNGFVRQALAFPIEHRYSERVGHDLVQRLEPRISEVPMAIRRWRSDTAPAPGTPAHADWLARAPILLDAQVHAPDWRRVLPGPDIRQAIRDQLLSPAAAEIYEVVDKAFAQRLLDKPDGNMLIVWRMLTLSVLADGTWETARPGDLAPITIPRPVAGQRS